MQRYISISLILLCFSQSLWSEENVNFCFDAYFQPLTFGQGPVSTAGLAVELHNAIFAEIPGYKSKIMLMDGNSCIAAAKRGNFDGVAMLYYTKERTKSYIYTDDVITEALKFYYLKTRFPDGLQWSNLQELTKYRIGLIGGSSNGKQLDDAMRKFDFNIQLVPDTWLNFKKLAAGRIDLVPEGEIAAGYYIRSLYLENQLKSSEQALGYYSFRIAMSKLSKKVFLVKKINQSLKTLKTKGIVDKLCQQYQISCKKPEN